MRQEGRGKRDERGKKARVERESEGEGGLRDASFFVEAKDPSCRSFCTCVEELIKLHRRLRS